MLTRCHIHDLENTSSIIMKKSPVYSARPIVVPSYTAILWPNCEPLMTKLDFYPSQMVQCLSESNELFACHVIKCNRVHLVHLECESGLIARQIATKKWPLGWLIKPCSKSKWSITTFYISSISISFGIWRGPCSILLW